MRLGFRQILLPAFAVTWLAGCEANQLYMAAHTVVGINAQVNPELSSGWVLIGYDRSFATLIPRSVQSPTTDDPQAKDAMAALACSSLWVKGIMIRHYTESIATGMLAGLYAAQMALGEPVAPVPRPTALGSLVHYITHAQADNFQPANITFDLLLPLEEATSKQVRDKRERHRLQCDRALAIFDEWWALWSTVHAESTSK